MAFTGKTAIITGGGSGIGRACALALGKQGARVAVWDINGVHASSVADEVKELGVRALQVRVDVADNKLTFSYPEVAVSGPPKGDGDRSGGNGPGGNGKGPKNGKPPALKPDPKLPALVE